MNEIVCGNHYKIEKPNFFTNLAHLIVGEFGKDKSVTNNKLKQLKQLKKNMETNKPPCFNIDDNCKIQKCIETDCTCNYIRKKVVENV